MIDCATYGSAFLILGKKIASPFIDLRPGSTPNVQARQAIVVVQN